MAKLKPKKEKLQRLRRGRTKYRTTIKNHPYDVVQVSGGRQAITMDELNDIFRSKEQQPLFTSREELPDRIEVKFSEILLNKLGFKSHEELREAARRNRESHDNAL